MMIFGLVVLLNCINLLSMRSWIQCLKFEHSSRACPLAPKWCSHFLDGSKSSREGLSLGLANIGVLASAPTNKYKALPWAWVMERIFVVPPWDIGVDQAFPFD